MHDIYQAVTRQRTGKEVPKRIENVNINGSCVAENIYMENKCSAIMICKRIEDA